MDTRAPFQHSGKNIAQLMQTLLLALLPGICASLWFFGYGILLNILIAGFFALAAEDRNATPAWQEHRAAPS